MTEKLTTTTTKTCTKYKEEKEISLFIKNSKTLKTCYQCRNGGWSPDSPFSCITCNITFKNYNQFNKHFDLHAAQKEHKLIENPDKIIKQKDKKLCTHCLSYQPYSEFESQRDKRETKYCLSWRDKINHACPHNKQKSQCQICDEIGYLAHLVSSRVYQALLHGTAKLYKTDHTLTYLGCTIEFYKGYLESLFKTDMNWQNHGKLWEIDHIIPIKFENPDLETVKTRLHYTNTQPLYASENRSKGNRFVG